MTHIRLRCVPLPVMRRRSGFSLVECVVAATLCAVGLLALSASAPALIDLALLGHRTAVASEIASARLATLRAAACDGAAAGTAAGTYAERWSLAGAGASRTASVDVTWFVGARPHVVRVADAFPCPG
jgi:Tfp pilus assembly protein PilV